MSPRDLIAGVVYTWEELGGHFDFKPAYLSAAGGMPVSSSTDSLLLITHPHGGKTFDYRGLLGRVRENHGSATKRPEALAGARAGDGKSGAAVGS